MMKRFIRTAAFAAAISLLSQTALAAPMQKSETVYVNLNSDGSIEKAFAVNEFKLSGQDAVLDYGDYKNIKNLSSDVKPKLQNGYIEWQVDPKSSAFYYQGELNHAELPWDFSFSYTLNGRYVEAEELAGKSGTVEIYINAEKNPNANSYFTENYLAQLSVSLDTEKCTAIDAPDAMTSNVGSIKTLTFMVLPKMSKSYQISFNAENFEFDGITIGLVKVSDGILGSIDSLKTDISSISGNISSLVDGSGQLNDGAQSLAQGLSMLNSGASSLTQIQPMLNSAMNEFESGVSALSDGSGRLVSGSGEIRSGLMQLDASSYEISKGIGQIESGLYQMTKDKKTAVNGKAQLEKSRSSVSELSDGAKNLKDGYTQIEAGLGTIAESSGEVSTGMAILSSNRSNIDYLTSSSTALSTQIGYVLSSMSDEQKAQMGQIVELLTAAQQYAQASGGALSTLYSSAESFADAAMQMASGADTMHTNMKTLNDGFNTMYNGIGKVDEVFDAAVTFADSTISLIEGAETIYSGVGALDTGFDEYSSAVGSITENYISIDNGLFDLDSGINSVKNGFLSLSGAADGVFSSMNELTDSIATLDRGASSLYNGAQQMDSGVSSFGSMLNGVDIASLISMTQNSETVSFTAPGIVSPESVVFIIKTPSVTLDDEEAEEPEPEKKGFFQKLIALFTGDK